MIELSLLKEVIYGRFSSIDRLNQAQQLEPVEILDETRVVWPPDRFLIYPNSLLVQALYLLAQGIIDVGGTGFAMLFKVPFRKEPGAILTCPPSPRGGYL